MDFKEWIQEIIKSGNLCSDYTSKVNNAKSNMELIKLCYDANGASYLCEMDAKGFPLPYEVICSRFRPYINGRYIAEYKNDKNNGYTSSLYCCFNDFDEIQIETTITTLLGCKTYIRVKENDFVQLYADKNCELVIDCPPSSRCNIDFWDGAKITTTNATRNIVLTKH